MRAPRGDEHCINANRDTQITILFVVYKLLSMICQYFLHVVTVIMHLLVPRTYIDDCGKNIVHPSEKFELTANSLGAHMKVAESLPSIGYSELILRTLI